MHWTDLPTRVQYKEDAAPPLQLTDTAKRLNQILVIFIAHILNLAVLANGGMWISGKT